MEKKKFVILGLGIFGSTLARDLYNYGFDVMAIDKNMADVERVSMEIADVLCLDFTDIEQLRNAGVSDCDVGIITTGSHLEDAILATLNLKELGVSEIIVKAKNSRNAAILQKIGADKTISPEKDVAIQTAKKLAADNIIELFDIDKDYSLFELTVPDKWLDKSMIDLQLRTKFNVNVIGLKRDGIMTPNFAPSETFRTGDVILLVTDNNGFKKINQL